MKKLAKTTIFTFIFAANAFATGKVDFITHPRHFSEKTTEASKDDKLGGAVTHGSKGGIKKESEIKERQDSIAEEKKKIEEQKEINDKATVHGSKGGIQKELELDMGDEFIKKILEILKRENGRLVNPQQNIPEVEGGDKKLEYNPKNKFFSEADFLPEEETKCDGKEIRFATANLLNLRSP